MEFFRGLTLALAFCVPVAAQLAAPELTENAGPSTESARALLAKETAERPLFAVGQSDGHYQLSIQTGQLDVPYMLSATISRGLGEVVHSGDPTSNFLFSFHRVGDTIQLMRLNTAFRAAPGSPEAAGVKAAYPDVPLASVQIATENIRAGFMIVPADGLFLNDLTDLQQEVAQGFALPASGLAPVPGSLRLEKLAAFHANVEVDVSLAFAHQTPVFSQTLPDSRVLPVAVRYSISIPPGADGFDVRAADPRVGYFTTRYRDYSAPDLKNRLDPLRRIIAHWRLEKKVPSAAISDVKKPIVWWVDEAAPARYRDAIKAGILAWNEAFAAVGLRHALVVKEVDKDMSPEERLHFNPADASYNMVRWFLDPSADYARGPSRKNPMTGEIYSATIMVSDQMSRHWDIGDKPNLAQGVTPAEKEMVSQQYITHTVMHEIGHTLGLRHNFKGSELLGLDELGKNGVLSSSVMDYLPINVPGPGRPKIYYQTKLGPYDLWAIEYGYKPLPSQPAPKSAALKEIARRADSNRSLAFGTDEDVENEIDPDAQRRDLSHEHVRYAETLIDRAGLLWRRSAAAALPEVVPPPKAALDRGLHLYHNAVNCVLPLIGGVRSDRRPTDEGGTRLRPVPAAEQRAALNFLTLRIFSARAFAVPPELELRATNDPLEESAGGFPDVPGRALALQRQALDHIYDPQTLNRLVAAEQIQPSVALKVSELFRIVRLSVWSELGGKGQVQLPLLRRQLQRAHVAELSNLANNANAPVDAVALARTDLAVIKSDALRAGARAVDPMVKAHLAEIARLAGAVLPE